jgi:hypothetical protein
MVASGGSACFCKTECLQCLFTHNLARELLIPTLGATGAVVVVVVVVAVAACRYATHRKPVYLAT